MFLFFINADVSHPVHLKIRFLLVTVCACFFCSGTALVSVVVESRKELTVFGERGGGLAWAGVSAAKYWRYRLKKG